MLQRRAPSPEALAPLLTDSRSVVSGAGGIGGGTPGDENAGATITVGDGLDVPVEDVEPELTRRRGFASGELVGAVTMARRPRK
jgi:hypothetical protein